MSDTFDVRSVQTGAQVIIGVDLETAREEKARLNAEARIANPETGKPCGLQCGEVTRYEVVSRKSGLTVGD